MIIDNDWLEVGLITSAHGIKGKVKVKSLSDFEERFTKPGFRWIQKDNDIPSRQELTSGYRQPGKEFFIISLKGINSRNQAEKLKKHKLLVKKNDLPKLQKEEFHLSELINLKVKLLRNKEDAVIGKVIDLDNEKNNFIIIEIFKNNKKVLVPFVEEIVPLVDIKNQQIIINPPKGLLDL